MNIRNINFQQGPNVLYWKKTLKYGKSKQK